MDRYEEMRVFAAVVDAESFVRAADELSMSKAAVSRYVADLEQRLGVRLLHRTTRRLSLTEEGAVFHARCKEILTNIDESEAEVSTRAGIARGRLKVSVPVSFGIRHLAPLWAKFMAAYPEISLDIVLSDRVVDLVDEGFDLAVRIARLADSSLISRKISATRLVLCASPEYIKRRGQPTEPAELQHHDVIAYTLMSAGDEWEFTHNNERVTVRVTPRLQTNNGDTCVAAALDGAGIILQPTFLVAEALASGELVELLPTCRSMELGIFAVYPTRKFVLPKVRVFVEALTTAFSRMAWI